MNNTIDLEEAATVLKNQDLDTVISAVGLTETDVKEILIDKISDERLIEWYWSYDKDCKIEANELRRAI